MSEFAGWISKGNLAPLLTELTRLAGIQYDEEIIEVLRDEVSRTDGDANPERWFSYEFSGHCSIKARLAIDQGTSVLRYNIECDDDLALLLESLLDLLERYKFTAD